MVENDEVILRHCLEVEEAGRDKAKFVYTNDALPHMMTWAELNETVVSIIKGQVNYNKLPFDDENEMYKGFALEDQKAIVIANAHLEPLCEALNMEKCLKTECPLYIAGKTPICREFKMCFKKG